MPPEVLTENQQRARDLAWREGQRHQRHAAARRRYRNSGRTLERADPNISEEDLRERARTASNENSFLAFAYRSMMQSTGRDPLMPAPQLVSSDSDSDGGDYLPVHVNIRAVGNRARISTSPPPSPSRPSSARIHYNTPRLTHYIEEANTGRGFIKEVSFSPEGKIVASPYGNGLRLLSFDDGCRDMCDSVNAVPRLLKAYALYEDCHSSDVLCTAFSPNHFSVVSGSKSGGIVWHDPKP